MGKRFPPRGLDPPCNPCKRPESEEKVLAWNPCPKALRQEPILRRGDIGLARLEPSQLESPIGIGCHGCGLSQFRANDGFLHGASQGIDNPPRQGFAPAEGQVDPLRRLPFRDTDRRLAR